METKSIDHIRENKEFLNAVAKHDIAEVNKILGINGDKFIENLSQRGIHFNSHEKNMVMWKNVHEIIGSDNKPLLNAISYIEKKMLGYNYAQRNFFFAVLEKLMASDMNENNKQNALTDTKCPHNYMRNAIEIAMGEEQFEFVNNLIEDMKSISEITKCTEMNVLVESMETCIKNNTPEKIQISKNNNELLNAVAKHDIAEVNKILGINEDKFIKNLRQKSPYFNSYVQNMAMWKNAHETIGSNNKPLLNAISHIEKKINGYGDNELVINFLVAVLEKLIVSDMNESNKQNVLTSTKCPHNHLRNTINSAISREQFKYLKDLIKDMESITKKTKCQEMNTLTESVKTCVKNKITQNMDVSFVKLNTSIMVKQGSYDRGSIVKDGTEPYEFHQEYHKGPKVECASFIMDDLKQQIKEKLKEVGIKRQIYLTRVFKDLMNDDRIR